MADPRDETAVPIDTRARARVLGAVAAGWLVPGLGHILVGRVRRGLFFGAIVWFCFAFGLMHDGRLALRDTKQPFLTTLQVVANLGMGPADVVARMAVYGEAAYALPSGGSAKARERSETFRERAKSGLSIYGTAYLWTAGLMNLLLLFDIWDLGRRRVVRE
jgi:hypothetical protein